MATLYELREMPDIDGSGRKIYYPHFCTTRQVSTTEIAECLSAGTTFSEGDVVGLLWALSDKLADEASRGNSVKLDGIGIFTPSLAFDDDMVEAVNGDLSAMPDARSVRMARINFKTDKRLLGKSDGRMQLVRRRACRPRSSEKFTQDQRLAMAVGYLKTHRSLSVRAYREMTGLLNTAATTELRRWASTPGSGITSEGRGTHKRYVAG